MSSQSLSAISGIMVEGISAGVDISGKGKTKIAKQDFQDADLIVALVNSERVVPQSEDCMYFKAWAIYGNNLIETSYNEHNIQTTSNKPKIVWAHRKPYILNGDR